MKKIKIEKGQIVIFFDLGNTLFYRRVSHKKQDVIFFRRYLPKIPPRKIVYAIEKAKENFSLVYRSILSEGKKLNLTEELQVYFGFIKNVLNFLKLKGEHKLWHKFINNRFGPSRYKLYNASLPILNLLSKEDNVKYGVISDGFPSRRLILKNLGIKDYFDPNLIFISSELGFSKNNPNLFYLVWRLIGKPKTSQIVLIDDNHRAVRLAKKIGWKSILLDKKTRRKPEVLLEKLNFLR